ncbi:MAG: hypothetical protein K0R26_1899 [Bacteroidota bacterium]|jgi:hypothetical protein|nr:hypothetical protein [Bacteroidota bacterium]
MIQKLVDTTVSKGRAERELDLSPRFEKFLRKKFKETEIKQIDLEALIKKYHLKGVVFGNYMSQEERYFYCFKTFKQIECLAKLKGSNDIGAGILILSIGAHGIGGNVLAHFSPRENIINLSRGRKDDYSDFMKGENSFVHEYGHFIDFYQGRMKDKTLMHNFASENKNPDWKNQITTGFSAPVIEVKSDESYTKHLRTPYLKSNIEVFARLFEAAITHYVHAHAPAYNAFFPRTYTEGIYYPKSKILKKGYDKKIVSVLRSSL